MQHYALLVADFRYSRSMDPNYPANAPYGTYQRPQQVYPPVAPPAPSQPYTYTAPSLQCTGNNRIMWMLVLSGFGFVLFLAGLIANLTVAGLYSLSYALMVFGVITMVTGCVLVFIFRTRSSAGGPVGYNPAPPPPPCAPPMAGYRTAYVTPASPSPYVAVPTDYPPAYNPAYVHTTTTTTTTTTTNVVRVV